MHHVEAKYIQYLNLFAAMSTLIADNQPVTLNIVHPLGELWNVCSTDKLPNQVPGTLTVCKAYAPYNLDGLKANQVPINWIRFTTVGPTLLAGFCYLDEQDRIRYGGFEIEGDIRALHLFRRDSEHPVFKVADELCWIHDYAIWSHESNGLYGPLKQVDSLSQAPNTMYQAPKYTLNNLEGLMVASDAVDIATKGFYESLRISDIITLLSKANRRERNNEHISDLLLCLSFYQMRELELKLGGLVVKPGVSSDVLES